MAKSNKAKAPKASKAPKTVEAKEEVVATEEVSTEKTPEAKAPKKAKTAKKGKKAGTKVVKAKKEKFIPELFEGKKARTLGVIGKSLTSKLGATAKTSIEIGGLLCEAGCHLPSQKLFLAWVEEGFGLKKSQAYNYKKIYQVFGGADIKELFAQTQVKILTHLMRDDAMLESAILALEAGVVVDANWVTDYSEEQKAIAKENREALGIETDEDLEEKKALNDTKAQAKLLKDAEANIKIIEDLEAQVIKLEKDVEAVEKEVEGEIFAKLLDHLEQLTPNLVLQVAVDAKKREINKAKRELSKIYDPANGGSQAITDLINESANLMLAK